MKSLETIVRDDIVNIGMPEEDVYATCDGLATTQPADDAQPMSENPMLLAKVIESAPSSLPLLSTYSSQQVLLIFELFMRRQLPSFIMIAD